MSTELSATSKPRRIEPREHTAFDGIPYYDAELDVAQSRAHRLTVYNLGGVLETIADEAGMKFLSDEPIWYLHPENDEQRAYYGDCVLGVVESTRRVTAEDLRVVIEVVTTSDRRKEIKDTGFQRLLNEYNDVPEFGLVFPELNDARALTWCRLVDGRYQAVEVAPGGSVAVAGVAGLELRVRPREQWREGEKVDVLYAGELRQPLRGERARAEQARVDAEQARADAEQARADAEQARQRQAAVEQKLRELGIEPNNI